MALPKLAVNDNKKVGLFKALTLTGAERIGSVAKDYTPKKMMQRAYTTIQSEISRELPELSAIGMSLGNFAKDVKSRMSNKKDSKLKIKNDKDNDAVDTTQLTKIRESLENIESYYPKMLQSINGLARITAKVWGVSTQELFESRKISKIQSKFLLATSQSKFTSQKLDSKFQGFTDIPTNNPKLKDKPQSLFSPVFLGEMLGETLGKSLGGILGKILKGGLGLAGAAASGIAKPIARGAKSLMRPVGSMLRSGIGLAGRGLSALAPAMPTLGVGAAGLAGGMGAGYFGLDLLAKKVDEITGKTDVVGTFLMKVVDGISNFFSFVFGGGLKEVILGKLKSATDYFTGGEFKDDVFNFFSKVFVSIKDGILNYTRKILANIIDAVPALKNMLPESVKNFVYNTQNTDNSNNQKVGATSNVNNINNISPLQTGQNSAQSLVEKTQMIKEYNTNNEIINNSNKTANNTNNVNTVSTINNQTFIAQPLQPRNLYGFNEYSQVGMIR